MSELWICGGRRLAGEMTVQGAKNSALPILAASLICDGTSVIKNCPRLLDVEATVKILGHLGCSVKRDGNTVSVTSDNASEYVIPERLMREMRSSVIFLGAILARNGRVVLSTPGGCDIGLRPIDLHLEAMKKLGSRLTCTHVHDNIGRMDLHQSVCFGECNWEKAVEYLKEMGYTGKFTYEWVYGTLPGALIVQYMKLFYDTADYLVNG